LSKGKAEIGNAAKAAPASAPWINSRRLKALWLDSVNAPHLADKDDYPWLASDSIPEKETTWLLSKDIISVGSPQTSDLF
jgi:hypothetical protein